MAQLTFTYEQGYVSNTFEGGVTLQIIFAEAGRHVIYIESRLSEEMPWVILKSLAVEPMSFLKVREPSEGQQYRMRTAFEPTFVEVTPLSSQSGSGSGNKEKIGSEDIEDGSIKIEDLSDEVKEQLSGKNLTDDDLENIFFPPSVTGIATSIVNENVVLLATAENIDEDEEVTWNLDIDGTVMEIDDKGTSLTLTTEQSASFSAAQLVKVRLDCSDYESEWFTLSTTADAGASSGEVSGDGGDLDE